MKIYEIVILVLTSIFAACELFRGLFAFVYGIRNEHVSSIGRGWRIAFNGVVLAGLAVAECLFFYKERVN